MIMGVTRADLGPIWYHLDRTFRRPLILNLQTSFLVGTVFANSYSKTALGTLPFKMFCLGQKVLSRLP